MTGEPCVLINRTSQPLTVTKNGVSKILKPGKNLLTTDWIRFAKMQNPRMGTFDQSGMNGDYLVGVEGHDDCSMIAPGQEHKNGGLEKFDRTAEGFDATAATAQPVATGIVPPMRRVPGEMSPLPNDVLMTESRPEAWHIR
jgi:hypothetical protein